MISIRRYVLYLGLVVLITVLITFFREPIRLNYGPSLTRPFRESLLDPDTGRLRWEKVAIRYPVKSVKSLPTAKSQTLPRVQYDFPTESASHAAVRKERQAAVKGAFLKCWNSYKEYAWMSDELLPLSGENNDGFGGWAATLVDSLDTLWIMGLHDEFNEAVDAAVKIDLSSSTLEIINVFETTIRHLGGFLSAYDLSGDERLLHKAKEFGDMLIVAFDTPNHVPVTRWRPFSSLEGAQMADSRALIAEIGSLSMEFAHLSQHLGDPKWYDAIDRITRILDKQQDKTFLPGMWPVTVNGAGADFTEDTLFTLSAMSDSLYEYFPKMHALLGGVEPVYRKLYESSMATAIKYVLWRPMTPDNADILISGQVRKTTMEPRMSVDYQGQHLVCFAGGMFALGSKLFDIPEHFSIGRKLVDGCIWTYKAMPLGIMPEIFRMTPCESTTECQWNETAWLENVLDQNPGKHAQDTARAKRLPEGFVRIGDRRYLLRPEAIESVFLLYRMTGDDYLLDAAWDMFTSIMNVTETPFGNAALSDVSLRPDQFGFDSIQQDSMESFWMAETLKYFYLIFSEPDLISLDEYVFNTEAHPFKRPLPG